MSRIELSELEIKVIEKQLADEFDQFDAPDEEKAALTSVMDKAFILIEELNAYEESGDDVVKWFYNKYKEQQKE